MVGHTGQQIIRSRLEPDSDRFIGGVDAGDKRLKAVYLRPRRVGLRDMDIGGEEGNAVNRLSVVGDNDGQAAAADLHDPFP